MASVLSSIRVWFRSTRDGRVIAFNVGAWILMLGVVLWVEGHVLPGLLLIPAGVLVLWAIGYVVAPWGETRWYRRAIRAWRDWTGGVAVAQDVAQREAIDIASRLEALRAPSRLAPEAEQLVALFRSRPSERTKSDGDARMRDWAVRLESTAAGVARITAGAVSPEERAYADVLSQALDKRFAGAAHMYDEAVRASDRFARFLSSNKPPARRAALQADIAAALDDYRGALAAAGRAVAARDFATLGDVSAEVGRVGQRMRQCREDLISADPAKRPVVLEKS